MNAVSKSVVSLLLCTCFFLAVVMRSAGQGEWQYSGFPVPAGSVLTDHTPEYQYLVRKILLDKSDSRWILRFLSYPSLIGVETLYYIRRCEEKGYVQGVLFPRDKAIWPDARDTRRVDALARSDYDLVLVEEDIDEELAIQIISLWKEMLEKVSYQNFRNDLGILYMDVSTHYFSVTQTEYGILEGVTSDGWGTSMDTVEDEATRIGLELSRKLSRGLEWDGDIFEAVVALRQRITAISGN